MTEYYRKNNEAPRNPRLAYIQSMDGGLPHVPLKPLIVLIDEFAEIMLGAGQSAKDFEDLVQRLVQTGRSTLVHLVLVTQRPDMNVLRGAVKANLATRVALAVPTHHDSMTVLGEVGAEELLGKGDMIFWSGTGRRVRLQGYDPD
jgi:S-DNA-T family DNA segregation ATPase FtsK/SpoIIIE